MPTTTLASCIFCDISYFAISWWILFAIAVVLGIALNIYELYRHYFKKIESSSKVNLIISSCHSVVLATIVSYALLSRYESINGTGSTPVLLATMIAVIYFAVLTFSKHTVKSHILSLVILSILGFIIWLTSNS